MLWFSNFYCHNCDSLKQIAVNFKLVESSNFCEEKVSLLFSKHLNLKKAALPYPLLDIHFIKIGLFYAPFSTFEL